MTKVSIAADPTLLDDQRREIALFRYGMIADFLPLKPGQRGLYKLIKEKAAGDYSIPGSLRRHVAAETIRGWLQDYRSGGFDALLPKERADRGSVRNIPAEVVDLLCHLKDERPELSVPLLIKEVKADHGEQVPADLPLPESTVHRLLSRRGLMKARPEEPTTRDRRRFEFEAGGEMWMSDVMYGPKLRMDGRHRQTYLIAFLDDATRLIPYAEFALSERATAYLSVFEQALRRRGIPKRLYVDNGSAFRSRQLSVVCARLGIALIHAKPYSPQGKGKMERWFRTVRMQFLASLKPEGRTSLTILNQTLAAWVEGEYHCSPHRGLGGDTPGDRWAQQSADVKMAPANLGELFLAEQHRRVNRDRTVTLDGIAFEVDAALVGERVALRFDPARRPDRRAVEVWHQGKRVEVARKVDTRANCFVRRSTPTGVGHEPRALTTDVPEGLSMRSLQSSVDDLDGVF